MPPSLARKLLICAAVDGLVIQPLAPKGQRPAQAVRVKYGDAAVAHIGRDQLPDVTKPNSSFEAFGVIGLFTVSRLSYLITITGRQQVALVRGYPVYVVTDVALTPCTSEPEASAAVRHTSVALRRAASSAAEHAETEVSDTEADASMLYGNYDPDDVQSEHGSACGNEAAADPATDEEGKSSIAEDVMTRRGTYGRFAQRWFSQKGWLEGQKRMLGISDSPKQPGSPANEAAERDKREEHADKDLSKAVVAEAANAPPASTGEGLLPKLLRFSHIWLGSSRSFFFSYDLDITRSLRSSSRGAAAGLSLHKSADPEFFWNRHLLQPFAAAKEESLLLPLMQGFVGQRSFVVDRDPPQKDDGDVHNSVEMHDFPNSEGGLPERPSIDLRSSEKKFLLTVLSRRSVYRAGLRYLRRGVDDEGCAANTVETEQLLSTPKWEGKVYSFVQTRGSIPLFFQQTPYSLKPLPVLQHSEAVNFKAFKKHFQQLGGRYGKMQLVNLVERHGNEAVIGNAYQQNVDKFNEEVPENGERLDFEWFDFHSACRGMKFENVSMLLDTLGTKLEGFGSTVENTATHELLQTQKGALRTNCMDCLDRTNVCQSSFAKYMLDLQLREEGFDMNAQVDQQTTWFNTLWADNGDAISKQYSSTAAMKGDYTRTRKRDYRGMVNDLGLSLTRFYNGMVNDYFSQAAIDFLLGNVTSLVFEEFEATMMTKDPAVSMSKMREQAIETSQKIAVADDSEDFIGGWTILTPHIPDTIKSLPFEEVVLLLTDAALYLCRFNWHLDKVSSFERVDLAHVVGIKVGTYVTSVITPAQADESKNVGLVVTYQPGKDDIRRVNTRSISSISDLSPGGQTGPQGPTSPPAAGILAPILGGAKAQQLVQPPKKIALKALYAHSSIADARSTESTTMMTEREQVDMISSEIERLVLQNQKAGGKESVVERGDIMGVAEAKRNTGLLEQLGHSLKKLVWA